MNSIDKPDCTNLPILDTELLSAFVAVIENGGFTAAARQLHKTQSTISQRIRTLEERVEVSLLHRTSRQVSLTADGETFLVYARRLLQLQREAISALGNGDREGVIRFGLPENYAEAWLPRLLDRFARLHPRIRPHIHCRMSSELIEALEGGELDLAMTVRHTNHGNGEPLGAETLVWAAHRDFCQDPKVALPLALFPDHCPYRQRALDSLTRQGRQWSLQYTSQSPTGLRMAVNQRNAVTVADRRTLPVDWRILGEADGLPPLLPAQLELHRSPSFQHPAGDDLITLLGELIVAESEATDAD